MVPVDPFLFLDNCTLLLFSICGKRNKSRKLQGPFNFELKLKKLNIRFSAGEEDGSGEDEASFEDNE